MSACWVQAASSPPTSAGVTVMPSDTATPPVTASPAPSAPVTLATESCEYCGADQLAWRKCKQICGACGQINRSCADL